MVRVDSSGTVTVLTGTSAHGQGHETTFSQIVADHLGVDFDKVVVKHGDTMAIPMGNGTGGSRSVAVGGSAVYGASLKVQQKARQIAASMLEASADDVVLQDGKYMVKGAPAKALGLAEIAAVAYGEGLKQDILQYYADPDAPISTKRDAKRWAQLQRHLQILTTMPLDPTRI